MQMQSVAVAVAYLAVHTHKHRRTRTHGLYVGMCSAQCKKELPNPSRTGPLHVDNRLIGDLARARRWRIM